MNKKIAAVAFITTIALFGAPVYADPTEELEQLEELVDQEPPAPTPTPMTICGWTATCTIVGSND